MRFVFGILAGIIALGLFAAGVLIYAGSVYSGWAAAACFMPAVSVASAAIGLLRARSRWRLFVALGLVGSVLGGAILLAFSFIDTLKYQQALAFWSQPPGRLAAHFPPSIPPGDRDVIIHADGEPRLGVSLFELAYTASQEQTDTIIKQFEATAVGVYDGTMGWSFGEQGAAVPQPAPQSYLYPPVQFVQATPGQLADLPADFRILLLKFNGQGDLRSVAWGYASGVAVSQQRGQVIFWAAKWFIS